MYMMWWTVVRIEDEVGGDLIILGRNGCSMLGESRGQEFECVIVVVVCEGMHGRLPILNFRVGLLL